MDIGGRSGDMVVFATVAEEGSLSAAARALGLTPSAVSRIIARTEQRLGTRLLLRTTRAITFTAEGEAYLRGARRILADMAEVEEAITDQGVPRGRLRVSAALGHGRLAIVPLVAAFSARYPNITVDLSLGDEVVDILGGQADVAVRFGHLPDSPLTARKVGETGQVVVASPTTCNATARRSDRKTCCSTTACASTSAAPNPTGLLPATARRSPESWRQHRMQQRRGAGAVRPGRRRHRPHRRIQRG